MTAIGLLGGTFNPIHIGHLRGAIDARSLLGLERVVLIPAGLPPLKETPGVSAGHRARMVELAVDAIPELSVDLRELAREGLSYTVDTLTEWREEVGREASLTFIMGADSVQQLDRWHRWQDLLSLANIAITVRPGCALPTDGVVADWLKAHGVAPESLVDRSAGGVALVQQPAFPVSSTALRASIQAGKNVRFLLPEAVMEYIHAHDLYRL